MRARSGDFRREFGGLTRKELQRQFAGRTFDLWGAGAYKALEDARGRQCAHAAGTVARRVLEML